jgi:Protein of unknown function (DUF1439)
MFLRRAVPSLNALLVLCFGAWWTFEKLAHIDINQSEIQQRLSAKFPIKRCVLLVCIELSSPVVTLSDGSDRIGFSSEVLASRGQQQFPGQVAFSGKVRYVRVDGKFYLDDIEIQTLQIAGVPPDLKAAVKVLGPGIIRTALQNYPIYTIKGITGKEMLAWLAVGDVQVVDGKLRVTFKLAKS